MDVTFIPSRFVIIKSFIISTGLKYILKNDDFPLYSFSSFNVYFSIWVLLYFLSIFPLKESDYRHFRFFRKQQTNGEHPIAKQIHHKLTVIDVSGKLLSTEKIQDPINWYVSAFEIRINNTLINVRINHPVNFWFNAIGSNPVKPENEMSYGAKIYPDFDNASPYRFSQKFSSYKGAID